MAARRPDFPTPATLVDVAIFALRAGALHVLLVQRAEAPFAGCWALPGGYVDVDRDADLAACARRKLQEKAGVSTPYLEQLGSWGNATRDPRGWTATHVHFALLPAGGGTPAQGANASDAAWFDAADLPAPLAFDHGQILAAALERLRAKVEYTSLPAFLLDEPFTLPELQAAYEVVLGRPVDKSGFRTRMLAAGFLEETGHVARDSHRPPMGYRLRDRTGPVVFPRTFSPRSGA